MSKIKSLVFPIVISLLFVNPATGTTSIESTEKRMATLPAGILCASGTFTLTPYTGAWKNRFNRDTYPFGSYDFFPSATASIDGRRYPWGLEGVAASGSLLRPLGRLAGRAGVGIGATLSVYGSITGFSRLSLMLTSGTYVLGATKDPVSDYRLYTVRGGAGYLFMPGKRCIILLFAGAGAVMHSFVTDTADGKSSHFETYPSASMGWEVRYAVGARTDVFLGPAVTLYMDRDNAGTFLTGSMGIRYRY